MRKFFIIGFVIFLLVSIVYVFIIYKNPIPDFEAQDLNHNIVSPSILKGKVVLINFWYPACPGCLKEMGKLNDLYKKYNNSNFVLLGVSANYNSLDQVQEYVKSTGVDFNIIYDKQNLILEKFEVSIMPMSFLITKKGNIYDSYIGEPTWAELEKNIKYLLNKN